MRRKQIVTGPSPQSSPFRSLLLSKLTLVLVLITLHVDANDGYAQNTVTLSERNSNISKVLKKIQRQTGFTYFAPVSILSKAYSVSIDVKNVSVTEALDKIFSVQPLTYKIVGKVIVVQEKIEQNNSVSQNNSTSSVHPPIDVRGRVVNEKGDPVEGVTVTVKGTKKATTTNANGEFSLNTVNPDAVLIFTSVNMETFEVEVSGRMQLAINLKTKVSALGEVTVMVSTGYQDIPKERATGSFVKVNNELFNRRVSTTVIDRLEGVTSGLMFNTNPRTDLNESPFYIRGRNTIFSNPVPLIIVDNFPYEGDISNLNPNDIESVTVLKDAAAASIWGARAGNGVIVITTKRGNLNRPLRIELNANVTRYEKPDLFYDRKFLPASAFIDLEKKLFGQGYYNADINSTVFNPISPVIDILAKERAGLISAAEASAQIDLLRQQDIRNGLNEHFYRPAINQQYSLSVSGGSDKTTYYFSAGYDKNLPATEGSHYERITVNAINSFRPIKRLEITAGLNYIQNRSRTDNTLSQISVGGPGGKIIYPYAILSDKDGDPVSIVKDYNPSFAQNAEAKKFRNWQFLPLKELREGLNVTSNRVYDIRLNFNLKYNLIPGLDAEIKYQYEKLTSEGETYRDVESYYTRNLINRYSILTSGNVSGYNIPVGGILDNTNGSLISSSGRGQLNYSRNWARHSIAAIAGLDINERLQKIISGPTVYGYDNTNATFKQINSLGVFTLYPSGNTSTIPTSSGMTQLVDRFRSFFTNISYGYANRYIVSLSGRIDQSNLFGVKTNQKSVPLWSTGFKWIIDKESFYNASWLPSLSLRITYGYNGNVNKSVSAFTTAFYTASTRSSIPYTYATLTYPGNPELRWEKIGMLNFGLDFSAINGRINGSIEYYRKKGKDIFGDAYLPPSTGYSSVRGNFADIKGRGVDIILNTRNIRGGLEWTTNFLFSHASERVTKYNALTPGLALLEGKPVSAVYSLRWGGLDPGTGNPRGIMADTLSTNYTQLNSMSLKERIYNGPALPTVFGAIRNTFQYQAFELSFNITFKAGYYFRKNSISYGLLVSSWVGHVDYLKRWQKTGDENTTNIPSMPVIPSSNISSRDAFYANSEVLVEKGDHIRFQDIRLSYELSKHAIARLPVEKLHFYLYANNLGIIARANKENIDPDFQTGYPSPRSLTIGLRANF